MRSLPLSVSAASKLPTFRLSSRLVSVGALLASLSVASAAHAQDEAASDGEFSIQRFRPAPGPRNFVNTSGARQDGNMAFSAGLMANYAYQPFVVVSCASEDDCEES